MKRYNTSKKHDKNKTLNSAFTMIELVITIVVMTLLLSVSIAGASIIKHAKIFSMVRQINEVQNAVNIIDV